MRTLLLFLAALLAAPAQAQDLAKATFAAGCFWCTEEAFDKVPGVVETVSGYMGGEMKNPSYPLVSTGRTGHAEVLQVTYDPKKVSYKKLLETFWLNHDPTALDHQRRRLALLAGVAVPSLVGQRLPRLHDTYPLRDRRPLFGCRHASLQTLVPHASRLTFTREQSLTGAVAVKNDAWGADHAW